MSNSTYTTEQIINYLSHNPHRKIEFINLNNKNIHVFRCIDDTIGQGEIGDGYIYKFDKEKFKDDIWLLSFNPYLK